LTVPLMFDFLGVNPLLGRTIHAADGEPGAPPVAVMAHKMWVKLFNGDPSVVGRTLVLNGVPRTIVGVMPARFTKLAADLWVPVKLTRADPEIQSRFYMFQARLKPGVTLEQATADLDAVAHRVAAAAPQNYPQKFNTIVVPWVDSIVGPFKTTLFIMSAAVGLLLLIACFNVAIMLLARATARGREMAVRASVGASRGRLVGQLLIESLMLAMAGAALGCLFAYAGIRGVVPLIPDGFIPREVVISLNTKVLVFSLAAAIGTVLLFGLAPALQTARRDIVQPLRQSGKGVSAGPRGGGLRNGLIVVEIALSLILLAGAGVLIRSFVKLQQVDLGVNPDNLLFARTPFPPGDKYRSAVEVQQFFQQLLPRLQRLPGVVAATESTTLPPYGGIGTNIDIPGKAHAEQWNGLVQLVSDAYAQTLGLRIVRGRMLTETDVNSVRKVAVVNQTLVSRYLGGEDPIGREVLLDALKRIPDSPMADPRFEIVGVIADAKNDGVQDPPLPEVLVPYTVAGRVFMRAVLIRTAGEPGALLNSVRREVWAVDRGVAITDGGTLNEYLQRFTYAAPQFSLTLISVFAGVGLVLVVIGVYSVVAYSVSRQTHEIGIRMALGAQRRDVFALVVRATLTLVGIGVVLGICGSIGVSRVLANQVWGVSPRDPATLGSVVAAMLFAALAACYVPARRAMKVDPMVALRQE
jgi:predicted permease